MRHIARPKFGASRVLHSRAREPRAGRATGRCALVALALGVACLGLPSISVASSTTLPPAIVAAGNAYARQVLRDQPIPPSAKAVATLPTPIENDGGQFPSPGLRHVVAQYLLPPSVSVDEYVRAHLPKSEIVDGTGTGGGPNTPTVYSLSVSRRCANQHVIYCGISYATTQAKNGQQELSVSVQVIYLPILHVKMPTRGVITLTGYGKTSLMDSSSDPSLVTLNHDQTLRLRTAIEGLKDLGKSVMCMEDSQLLKIKIVRSGKVVWSATADACPGGLTITSATTSAILDNRNCSFWHAVDNAFPSGEATATKTATRDCDASQFG